MVTVLLFISVIAIVAVFWDLDIYNGFRRKYHFDTFRKPNKEKLPGDTTDKQDIWRWLFESERDRRKDYYRNEYLKSDAWQRKRYVVLKRDNWTCVYCGGRATQVHHKRYARNNIGKEPIDWLVAICKPCHDLQHR